MYNTQLFLSCPVLPGHTKFPLSIMATKCLLKKFIDVYVFCIICVLMTPMCRTRVGHGQYMDR